MVPDLALPALMGVLLGASAHRAGLCTVKAVAEIMTTGQAHVLWSLLKASLWTMGLLSVAALAGAEGCQSAAESDPRSAPSLDLSAGPSRAWSGGAGQVAQPGQARLCGASEFGSSS